MLLSSLWKMSQPGTRRNLKPHKMVMNQMVGHGVWLKFNQPITRRISSPSNYFLPLNGISSNSPFVDWFCTVLESVVMNFNAFLQLFFIDNKRHRLTQFPIKQSAIAFWNLISVFHRYRNKILL